MRMKTTVVTRGTESSATGVPVPTALPNSHAPPQTAKPITPTRQPKYPTAAEIAAEVLKQNQDLTLTTDSVLKEKELKYAQGAMSRLSWKWRKAFFR